MTGTSEGLPRKREDAEVCSAEKYVKLLHWIPPSAYLLTAQAEP